ncbi:hypothetical protein [Chondromyces apiculatus]|uniref:hypothetical protein n=1 Tax=Chondromyces apiculatus TaxID=51 RepID=UPI0012DF035B|nr:hypothetical protein [Chondromyces apiculatus]
MLWPVVFRAWARQRAETHKIPESIGLGQSRALSESERRQVVERFAGLAEPARREGESFAEAFHRVAVAAFRFWVGQHPGSNHYLHRHCHPLYELLRDLDLVTRSVAVALGRPAAPLADTMSPPQRRSRSDVDFDAARSAANGREAAAALRLATTGRAA